MGTCKYTSTIKTLMGETMLIEIHDVLYDGSSTVIPLSAPGFELTLGGNGAELYANITRGSELALFIEVRKTDTSLDAWLLSINTETEQRYFVKIFRNTSLFWVGEVLQDLNNFPDALPYTFTLNAACGLGRINKIDYNYGINDANPAKVSLLELLYNALIYCGSSILYGGSDIFIVSTIDWWEIDQRITQGALVDTRLNRLLFVEDLEQMQPMKCQQVLNEILAPFNAHIRMVNGAWHIIHPDAYTETNVTLYKYTKGDLTAVNSTASIVSKVDISNANNIKVLTEAAFSFRPGLKSTHVDVFFDSSIYLTKLYNDSNWNATVSDIENGDLHALLLEGKITYEVQQITVNDVLKQDGVPRLTLYIDCGKWRLTDVDPTNDDAGMVWTENKNLFMVRDFAPADDGEVTTADWALYMPELPPGETEITIFGFMATVGGLCQPNLSWGGTFRLRQEIDTDLFEETVQYQADNDDYQTGSEIAELTILYSDLDNTFSNNSPEIYTGSEWKKSIAWAKGSGAVAGVPIAQLLADTVSGRQQKPVHLLDANITHGVNYNYIQCLYWRGLKLMLNGAVMTGMDSTINGEWFGVQSATGDITSGTSTPFLNAQQKQNAINNRLFRTARKHETNIGAIKSGISTLNSRLKTVEDQIKILEPAAELSDEWPTGTPTPGDIYTPSYRYTEAGTWERVMIPL